MMAWAGLTDRWRSLATEFRRYGGVGQAEAMEACAADLEAAELEYLLETLTVQEAATELDVSYETMRRRIGSGELPNSGEKHKPRVRRIDLMKRAEPSGPRAVTDHGEPDIADIVLRSRT